LNFVFWLLAILALVFIWFCLSFAFKGIGGIGWKLWSDVKKEVSDEDSEKEK